MNSGRSHKKTGVGEMFAKSVALQALKKSCRATKEMLRNEKGQIHSIQVDLGVSLMNGDPIRQPLKILPNSFEEMKKMIEFLKREKDARTERDSKLFQQIIRSMPFFRSLNAPFTQEDCAHLCKIIKYDYYTKGEAIRRAGEESDRLYFILEGKVTCSFQTQYNDRRTKTLVMQGAEKRTEKKTEEAQRKAAEVEKAKTFITNLGELTAPGAATPLRRMSTSRSVVRQISHRSDNQS